ncbi:fimbria/pilus chaperone family protein [Ralstonia sp. SET104]|uniref:fimbria/pilus chaperone family protein n=1 Tax=Ralstonia sp. SET104 TaxID=2448774 RepID=UPI000F570C4F|nr:fimbria/pilus chaperone family protein [Ralstonia sp. SET104]GCB06824.1 fimbrial protein [Ralstonia sp. SET104]
MKPMQSKTVRALLGALFVSAGLTAHAAGMLPESTVVLINEADGEASMVVTNTDASPSLLYSKIEAVEEDASPPVILTPPVTRVDPSKKQTVRFMLTHTEPLTVQRYARVTFDGIPERKGEGKNVVTLTVRQNLPIVIHPKSLAEDKEPWKHLKWSANGDTITVSNDSAYVVRMDQRIKLLPGDVEGTLAKSYLVPGSKAEIKLDAGKGGKHDFKTVQITPFTAYGYATEPYQTELGAASAAAE